MKRKEHKYNIGDYVVISKFFKIKPHGHFVSEKPVVCEVIDVTLTSIGPSYKLKKEGIDFKICYWEDDIDHKIDIDTPEERYWKVWGDR